MVALTTLLAVIIGIAYVLNTGMGAVWGLPVGTGATLMGVFPGLFVIALSMFGVGKLRNKPVIMGVLATTGIGVSVFLGELNAVGLLDVAMLGGYALADVQILCVILGILLGIVAYATGDR